MKVELSRFRVKPGKSGHVDDWLKMLNDNMGEAVQTLERELMKLEVIFREIIVPGRVAQAMDWNNAPAGTVEFQRRELIHRRPSQP